MDPVESSEETVVLFFFGGGKMSFGMIFTGFSVDTFGCVPFGCVLDVSKMIWI